MSGTSDGSAHDVNVALTNRRACPALLGHPPSPQAAKAPRLSSRGSAVSVRDKAEV
ncbi:hypothetical protein [Streptomyces sp. NPDC000229]|uniref:hypothetical protein n=1 Tax=Streptomyces sp. NPDC000229 TaxID=3154247 RepID=UPI0033281C02